MPNILQIIQQMDSRKKVQANSLVSFAEPLTWKISPGKDVNRSPAACHPQAKQLMTAISPMIPNFIFKSFLFYWFYLIRVNYRLIVNIV